jgi:hypothetical protein
VKKLRTVLKWLTIGPWRNFVINNRINDPSHIVSRDSSVGIATGYGLDNQGKRDFESRKGKKFSLLHIVHTGSGVHPTSYKMGTRCSFPGVKRQGREADHSTPTSAEVKKM